MAFKPNFSFGSTNKPTLNLGTNTNNPPAASATGTSLFGTAATASSQPASTSLFGSTPGTNQSTSLFGSAPTASLGAGPGVGTTSLFGSAPTGGTGAGGSTLLGGVSSAPPNPTSTTPNSAPQIDEAHLRSTTRYEHLAPYLQDGISQLDAAILNQIRHSSEVGDLLPAVINVGSQLAPAIDFVSGKLDELETGLENDAEAIVNLRDEVIKKDAGDARCVFRAVDRLKVPRQYQVGHTTTGEDGGRFGATGMSVTNGLTGWWNNASTHVRGSLRAGGAGQSVQLVDEDIEDDGGPKTLINLFDEKTKDQTKLAQRHIGLLSEIENFVDGLDAKVLGRERELNERLEQGSAAAGSREEEREHQMALLRFVFGEVQRNLYEVAEKVGMTRNGITELGLGR